MELSEETKNIRATLIIEVVGRPPEHLVETLKEMIANLKNEKGVKIIEDKINESCPLKDKPEFCTNFSEIEIEVETIEILILLMFKYMPSHVEIISPEKINLNNHRWSEVLSDLIRRLHQYDEVARLVQMEKGILEKKLRDVLEKNKPETENKEEGSEEEKGE